MRPTEANFFRLSTWRPNGRDSVETANITPRRWSCLTNLHRYSWEHFLNYAGLSAKEVASHFQWRDSDGLPHSWKSLMRTVIRAAAWCWSDITFMSASSSRAGASRVTTFLTALRSLVVRCEFPDPDNMIRNRLVIGVGDHATQRALLR